MPNVRQIIKRYPKGTKLQVWIRDFGGPSSIGMFEVGVRTIHSLDHDMPWGDFVKVFYSENRFRPVIARVKPE